MRKIESIHIKNYLLSFDDAKLIKWHNEVLCQEYQDFMGAEIRPNIPDEIEKILFAYGVRGMMSISRDKRTLYDEGDKYFAICEDGLYMISFDSYEDYLRKMDETGYHYYIDYIDKHPFILDDLEKGEIQIFTPLQIGKKYGWDIVSQLTDMEAVASSLAATDGKYKGLVEMRSGSVYVDGGKLDAVYHQPEGADDWEFGSVNGIYYGDIDYIEFSRC